MNNINVDWDNEQKTILRYQFKKGWSWDELRDAFREAYDLIDTVNHPVNVIMDFTDASVFAPSGAINQARHVMNNPKHTNVGLTAVVGSRFISGIFNLMNRLIGTSTSKWDVTFMNTMDEAYAAIQAYEDAKKKDEDAKK